MLDALKRRYIEARIGANLPGYRQPPHPWLQRARYGIAVGALTLYCLFLGVLIAIFPLSYYLYLAAPVVVLFLLVIWVLPETGRYSAKTISRLFWCFFVSIYLWPNYLAIAIPGLPWITIQRLFLGPLTIVLLISFSQAEPLRAKIRDAFNSNRAVFRLLIAFIVIQCLTLALSPQLDNSINRFINNQLVWTIVFLSSCIVFSDIKGVERWTAAIIIMCMILSVISFLELRNQGVLWADHVPSFLKVEGDDAVGPMSPSFRRASDLYRVKATFGNPLLLAEILGLSTPFVIHGIIKAQGFWIRAILIAYLPVHFLAIRSTDGRLGSVCFFTSFLIMGLFWGVRHWRSNPRSLVGPAVVVAYPLLASCFFVLALTWTRLYRAIFGGGAQAASNEGRKEQWIAALPKIAEWPFGRGTASSGPVLGFVGSNGQFTIDSYYITVLLEYGVIGFFVYFAMFGIAGGSAIRRYVGGGPDVLLPIGAILLIFILDKSVLSLELIHPLVFMALGIAVSMNRKSFTVT